MPALLRPLFALALLAVLVPASAEEGMWTLDRFPAAAVAASTGVAVDRPWLDHVEATGVRLSSGCSGGVVSQAGLVVSNQHCLIACLQSLVTPGHDPLAEGFIAQRRDEERPCPGLTAEILEAIEDVTAEVVTATADLKEGARTAARRRITSAIEARGCLGHSEAHCEVVELYQGAQVRLYRYRRYEDVRLVFAPEFGIAFFGGDVDNYSYPRHSLDVAFLRLYRDGEPAAMPDHLAWRATPPRASEPVFLAGHPAATSRQMTVAELEMQRDWFLPVRQLVRAELRGRLLQYAAGGAEQARAATDAIFDVENHFKWFQGRSRALADAQFFGALADAEAALRGRVAADAALRQVTGDPWAETATAMQRYREIFLRHEFLEARAGAISELYRDAVLLVRAARERQRADGERLPEFRDARLAQLERQLLEAHPFYPDVERIGLELWLSKAREYLGADSAEVRALLGLDAPETLAARLVSGTRLADPVVREALWRGGADAVGRSDDPLIRLVRDIDPLARAVRDDYEQGVVAPVAAAAVRIAEARFAAYGDAVYPDATFSLRLSYGRVAGWREGGRDVPPWTTFGELMERSTGVAPYVLPARWRAGAGRLEARLPFDFVATVDTVNGNSGAPVLDADGELVGVAFDGNLASLGGEYGYDGRRGRGVAVSAVAVSAALSTIYGMRALADELSGR